MGKAFNSPIIVVRIAFAALGLTLVPFAVWNTDHAAAFYGSFFAAIVAAAAAFSGYFIQSHLTEAREGKAQLAKHTSEIVELYFWLRYLLVCLIRAQRVLDKRINQDAQPDSEDEPFFKLNAIARKAIMLAGAEKDTKQQAAKALHLPAKMRITAAGRMYYICELAENMKHVFDLKPNPEALYTLKSLKNMKSLVVRHKERLEKVNKGVEDYLEKIGALNG